jgi:hypothetical protein
MDNASILIKLFLKFNGKNVVVGWHHNNFVIAQLFKTWGGLLPTAHSEVVSVKQKRQTPLVLSGVCVA